MNILKKDDISIFDDMSNLAEIKKLVFHYERYESVYFESPLKESPFKFNIEKEWYLMGIDFKKDNTENIFTHSDILFSLIELARKIVSGSGLYDIYGKRDELSFFDEIVEWCKKYGLPYSEEYFNKNYYPRKDPIPPFGYCAFRIWEFKRQIAMLYDQAVLWLSLCNNNTNNIIKHSKRFGGIDLNKNWNDQIKKIKEALAHVVWYENKIGISIKYDKKSDEYNLIPYTDSLLDVAYFQFIMFMIKGSKTGVKFCSNCKKLFETEHGNAKVCKACTGLHKNKKRREYYQRSGK